jgi:N4-gp56 family major capsid protein
MAVQNYSTNTPRIGKIAGAILAHAIPVEVLGITGKQEMMPKNKSDTIIFQRYLPYGGSTTSSLTENTWSVTATNHLIQEGVTPAADTLATSTVTAVLRQYGALYAYTDKTADLNEDDYPAEMKRQLGERIGLVREMVRYGELKACTNLFYSGGTSRATVDEDISINLLRRIGRNLQARHAQMVTGIIAPSANFGTSAIQAAYLVFAHTDCESDIRDLPGFVPVAEYGARKVVHEREIGSCENYRFILSPELASIADSGAAVGSTGLYSTTGSNIDVYPVIVTGMDAWGQVALRGMDSLNIRVTPPDAIDKNDPLGQRGYIGATCWFTAKVLNNGWMAVAEVGVTALS